MFHCTTLALLLYYFLFLLLFLPLSLPPFLFSRLKLTLQKVNWNKLLYYTTSLPREFSIRIPYHLLLLFSLSLSLSSLHFYFIIVSLLFFRLFIEKLPKHSEYSKAPQSDKARVKKLVKSSFDQALLCKKRLKEKYTQEKELYCQRKENEVSNTVIL